LVAIGFLAAVFAVRNIAACLPSLGRARCDQTQYILKILAPLSVSAILLNMFWAAWHRPGGQLSPGVVVVFGAVVHWVGWWLFLSDAPGQKRTIRLFWAAVSGAIGGLVAYLIAVTRLGTNAELLTCFAFPIVMGIFFFATALFIGLDSARTTDEDREWWARSGGWILIVAFGWILASVLVVYGKSLAELGASKVNEWIFGAGLGSGVAGSLAGRSAMTSSSKQAAGKSKDPTAADSKSDFFSSANGLKIVTTLAPLVFLFALLVAISELSSILLDGKIKEWIQALPLPAWIAPMPVGVLALMIVVGGVAVLMSKYINVNTFSLHAMYRSRLIRAYLGATNLKRRPNPFTGFDPGDNLHMHKLPAGVPFHIVNMALNLVHGKRLAWQERKAETFTVSRLHSGSIRIGYQKTGEYGGRGRHAGAAGITLGTAMAISGAAASPNMGYHSSPLLTFLMTFFNARLGWWLANPGYPGEDYWPDAGPRSALRSLIAEALGDTDDENRYVYLSDGGHFENLALYEMILRRCTSIVIIDAGADPGYTFEDLGNAIRKIRVDLGVSIVFKSKIDMTAREDGNAWCAVASIDYGDANGPESKLLYIKPVINSSLSVDLKQYRSMHQDFPQQPTADQFFDEAQFESYRRLGYEILQQIAGSDHADLTVDQLLGKCGPPAA
ncbi:MAG TPA: hypothetical protein VKS01_07555, partial [Bryobacteraceae bacterium]|nr:hypothetical protein [Bryobacteraceae bacterium]